MPSITATGLGSGLDIESIVSGLMAVERRPLELLEQRQSDVQAKISAIGSLSSALSAFKTSMSGLKKISAFEVYKAVSSDEKVFTATANSSAVAGSYSIDFSQVSHQLATAHKMKSTNFSDTSIGASGSMEIKFGATGAAFSIAVDGSNDTLAGIRDAINDATDNIGVTATIIKVDSGSHLVLTSDKTGTDSGITLTDLSGNVNSTLAMTNVTVAKNAVFSIDGNTVTSQSNTIENAIEGVTINLIAKGALEGSLAIENDSESVKKSVQGFVDAYNKMTTTFKDLRAGKLSGDNVVLSMESQFRNVFNTTPTGLPTSLKYLSDIGISTNKAGELTLNTTKLDSKLKLDFDGISQLLANDSQGYVFRLESAANNFLTTNGLIASRKETLNSQSEGIKDRISNTTYRMELIEKRYRTQFASLDGLMSNLSATGSFLTQQLSSLPGSAR